MRQINAVTKLITNLLIIVDGQYHNEIHCKGENTRQKAVIVFINCLGTALIIISVY